MQTGYKTAPLRRCEKLLIAAQIGSYGIFSYQLIISISSWIYRCTTDDTALYTVVATNIHGQASCQAAVLVKSESCLEC